MAWINFPAYIQKTFFFFFSVVFCSFGRWGCGHAPNYRNSVLISSRMWRHVNVTWNGNRTDFLERFWFWQMDLTKGHMTSYFSIILFFCYMHHILMDTKVFGRDTSKNDVTYILSRYTLTGSVKKWLHRLVFIALFFLQLKSSLRLFGCPGVNLTPDIVLKNTVSHIVILGLYSCYASLI